MTEAHQRTIGQAVPRREDARLLRGEGQYAADVRPDDVLHIVFARSTMPRCKIVECDVAAALEMDGVVSVITGEDVEALGILSVAPILDVKGSVSFPVLARDSVAAVGQAIAAVVAESVNQGLDAIDCMYIDLEEDEETAATDAGFSGSWSNGDVDALFGEADTIVDATVEHPLLAPSPMEPRAITVEYDAAADSAVIWLATQTPHRARDELAKILNISKDRLHVAARDVGGAFGMKASLYPEDALAVWAAFKLKRSVKWVATRNDDFLTATHGRGASTSGQLALMKDGRFLAMRASIEAPLGHWLPTSSAVPAWNAGRVLPCGYRIDAVDIKTDAQTSDRAPVGIYRGAGRPEANCLMERLVDEAAVAIGMDPVEIRLQNLLGEDEFPYETPTGNKLDSGRYREALQDFCARVDYPSLLAERDQRRAAGDIVGIGIGFYVEPCGKGWESARVTLNPDGTVLAATGGSSQGHGRETAISQIVAERLGVPMEKITVDHSDTRTCPAGIGALASRSTAIGGSAIATACEQLNAERSANEPITAEVVYEANSEAWGYGCYIVGVVIDKETGVLDVDHAACLDDIGTVINPLLVDGQIMGGFAQGIGEALLEEVKYDEYGQLLTGSFTDYTMPRADDIPGLTLCKTSTPSPENVLGSKGVGEAGTIGTPAAILNAALDALRPLGVQNLSMPLTSHKLWAAINDTR